MEKYIRKYMVFKWIKIKQILPVLPPWHEYVLQCHSFAVNLCLLLLYFQNMFSSLS
jgi:hypothetical protein